MITTNIDILKAKNVDVSLIEAPAIIEKLEEELFNSEFPGVGLAAPQIGINKRVCIIRAGKESINLVNPVIVDKDDLRLFRNEGCLSFPDELIMTKRYNEIFVKDLLNPSGIVCTGLTAVIVQHEIAHTNGETMHDYQITLPRVNDKCWCGSEKKFKKCHMKKEIVSI